MNKKVGIIGSGVVARNLAQGFTQFGYQVTLGTAHPENLQDWEPAQKEEVSLGSFAEAAKFGDLLVLAIKGFAALEVLHSIGAASIAGKTIIDTTNPIANEPIINNVLSFFSSNKPSLLESLQEHFPQANFVKAFNSIGAALMVNPSFGDQKPSMFICGNNEQAKKEVTEIVELFGFETEDLGKQEAARAIEPLCILWCIEGFAKNIWDKHAIKLIRTA